MFFIFEGLWWKFFGALEAWIHRASLICDLLMFSDTLSLIPTNFRILVDGLDDSASNVLRFWGWSSWRLWGLILVELFHFWILVPLNVLGRLLFIGVWGWMSDTWRSLIGDTCYNLIGLLMSSLTRARLLVSSLTCVGLLVSSLTRADVWLVSTWHLTNFCWFLNSDNKT